MNLITDELVFCAITLRNINKSESTTRTAGLSVDGGQSRNLYHERASKMIRADIGQRDNRSR